MNYRLKLKIDCNNFRNEIIDDVFRLMDVASTEKIMRTVELMRELSAVVEEISDEVWLSEELNKLKVL